MPVAAENSTMAEHLRLRVPRKQTSSSGTDPRHPHINVPSVIQSTSCKSAISSLLFSSFANTQNPESSNSSSRNPNGVGHANDNKKKKDSKNSGLRGFGCTAQPEVALPAAVVRTSADWREKKKSKNKKKNKKDRESILEVQDLWCGAGIGFGGGFASDDFVASTRPVSGRGKIDVDEVPQGERTSYMPRRRVNLDYLTDLDMDSALENPWFASDVFEARYNHHLRNYSHEELSEITMFHNRPFMGARYYGFDRYRELRLETENMSYEDLLELGERIGHVNAGLKEDEIVQCIRKAKLSSSEAKKCSICQEEYEREDEVGRLGCRHMYHMKCIKQWLAQKNSCPICKVEASTV